MGQHIEWSRATSPPRVTDYVTDGHGTSLDPGNVGLCVGDGAVVEGTPDELRSWLSAALALLDNGPPRCPSCTYRAIDDDDLREHTALNHETVKCALCNQQIREQSRQEMSERGTTRRWATRNGDDVCRGYTVGVYPHRPHALELVVLRLRQRAKTWETAAKQFERMDTEVDSELAVAYSETASEIRAILEELSSIV